MQLPKILNDLVVAPLEKRERWSEKFVGFPCEEGTNKIFFGTAAPPTIFFGRAFLKFYSLPVAKRAGPDCQGHVKEVGEERRRYFFDLSFWKKLFFDRVCSGSHWELLKVIFACTAPSAVFLYLTWCPHPPSSSSFAADPIRPPRSFRFVPLSYLFSLERGVAKNLSGQRREGAFYYAATPEGNQSPPPSCWCDILSPLVLTTIVRHCRGVDQRERGRGLK